MDKGLSYFKGNTNIPLDNSTLGQVLELSAIKHANKMFIISKEQQQNITLEKVLEEVDHLASGLLEIGLTVGDKIGIIISNIVEAYIVNFACIRGGFVSVNLNPALQCRELEYCIKTSQLNAIICLDKYKIFNILDVLKQIVPEIEDDKEVLDCKNVSTLKHIIILSDKQYKGTRSLEDVKNLGKTVPKNNIKIHQDSIKPEDLFTILFTSGTTGNPKAVGLTHFQMNNTTRNLSSRIGLTENQMKLCFVLPMFHLFGLGFSIIAARYGSTLVLPSQYYSPEKTLEAINEERCTLMLGTPTMFSDIVAMEKNKNLDVFLERALCGGAPGNEQLYRDILQILKVKHLHIGYGATETLAVSWPLLDDEIDVTSKTIGYLVDHLEGKVVDSDENIVPIGTIGEFYVRGFSVIQNYLSASSDAFKEDGWFATGDAMYFDSDGKLYIVGRLKEIINRGGEKLSPLEVEEVLEKHDDIIEAHVVGTHHDRLGEEVCACLKVKPGAIVTLDDVKNFCKGQLSYYKIPSRIEIMDTFPKTTLGKIQRVKLLEQIKS